MTRFIDTAAGADFVASASSRETSTEIMMAIAAFAQDSAAAETIWEERITNWDDASAQAFVDTATQDGRLDPSDLVWGAGGSEWAPW